MNRNVISNDVPAAQIFFVRPRLKLKIGVRSSWVSTHFRQGYGTFHVQSFSWLAQCTLFRQTTKSSSNKDKKIVANNCSRTLVGKSPKVLSLRYGLCLTLSAQEYLPADHGSTRAARMQESHERWSTQMDYPLKSQVRSSSDRTNDGYCSWILWPPRHRSVSDTVSHRNIGTKRILGRLVSSLAHHTYSFLTLRIGSCTQSVHWRRMEKVSCISRWCSCELPVSKVKTGSIFSSRFEDVSWPLNTCR